MARNRSERFGETSAELLDYLRQQAIGPKVLDRLVTGSAAKAEYWALRRPKRTFYRNLMRAEAGLEPTSRGFRENRDGQDA